jgi:hypothetical protein
MALPQQSQCQSCRSVVRATDHRSPCPSKTPVEDFSRFPASLHPMSHRTPRLRTFPLTMGGHALQKPAFVAATARTSRRCMASSIEPCTSDIAHLRPLPPESGCHRLLKHAAPHSLSAHTHVQPVNMHQCQRTTQPYRRFFCLTNP